MTKFFLAPIYFFTFITGAAGLIYEVTWQKYLSRILGSDSVATAVILATFLGGLSAGYYLCGKLTTKVRNHFKAYALLEGIIAVWGLFFPVIFGAVDLATRGWTFSPPILVILQGLLCSGLLMGVPTICMGGTIPFLTRGISQSVKESTGVHARVYGINTAGAFMGALIAGFFLIPSLGLPVTVRDTAILNFSAALFFLFASIRLKSREAEVSDPSADGKQVVSHKVLAELRYQPLVLYTVAFLGGFYVMMLENVLIRLINLSLGSSSYSFTMIISVFILAIAIGSYAVGRLKRLPRSILFFNQLFIALLLMGLYFSFDTWPYWAHLLRISIQSNIAGFWTYYANVFLVLTFVLILPVSLMGATVPITFHEIKRDLASVGKQSGLLFSWNTIGNLTGSLVGGVALFYILNLPGIFCLAIFLAALSACLVAWKLSKIYFSVAAAVGVTALVLVAATPLYEIRHFTPGIFQIRSLQSYSMGGPQKFFAYMMGNRILEFYKDGTAASVAVMDYPEMAQFKGQKAVSIIINGKTDSSTVTDIYTLKLLAHIPAILSSQRQKVMVIGLGTGVTAGELTLYPDIERIDVAEISQTVVEALPYFSNATYDVHKNPKVKIHIGDAFRILGRSKDKWDIIISEPSNPWVTGVDLLFTKEFYSLAKQRLSANGILLQWVQIYDADIEMVGMIVKTMMQEFRQCHVFMSNPGDLLIVATDKEFTRDDLERSENMLRTNEAVRASLDIIHLSSLDGILLRELWSPSLTRSFFRNFRVQTMDNPRLHYMAGKLFFMGPGIEENVLLGTHSITYMEDYLLVKRHPEWANFTLDSKTFRSFLESARDLAFGTDLPMAQAIRLKAYLYDSNKFSLTEQDKRFFAVDLIPLITGKIMDKDAWVKVGLNEASYRRKAEAMLSHIGRHRNWVVPYPIDGLKVLLEKGIIQGADDLEKNWCSLVLAYVLINERTDMGQIRAVLDRLKRDKDGRVLLKNGDGGLWEVIQTEMKNLASSGG
ncbi:MAG: spermine/spermidine synthase domain-containing protein [Thermodesulfobacteriota bacterium]